MVLNLWRLKIKVECNKGVKKKKHTAAAKKKEKKNRRHHFAHLGIFEANG